MIPSVPDRKRVVPMATRPTPAKKAPAKKAAAKQPAAAAAKSKAPAPKAKAAAPVVTLKALFEQLGEAHALPKKQAYALLADFVAAVTTHLIDPALIDQNVKPSIHRQELARSAPRASRQ